MNIQTLEQLIRDRASRVDELAQKLLSAVDQIEELTTVVDNIRSEVSNRD